jgi:hypothetical protein
MLAQSARRLLNGSNFTQRSPPRVTHRRPVAEVGLRIPRLAILGDWCGLSARDATDQEADTVMTHLDCPNCRRTLVPKLVIRGGVWRGSGRDPGITYKCRWCDYEWPERVRQAS